MPVGDTLPMAADSAHDMATELTGHVVVVAARAGAEHAAVALAAAGATVAVITDDSHAVHVVEATTAGAVPVLVFRADSTDVTVWTRIAPHLEQRLGPIDAVVTDTDSEGAATATLLDDLRRRGHGGVLSVDDRDVVEAVRSAIRRTP
jgi:NAD(P)-dependent dehydrogenase (short-subunit alcohol dehydrogenase family)